jgi:hypothetical protein
MRQEIETTMTTALQPAEEAGLVKEQPGYGRVSLRR